MWHELLKGTINFKNEIIEMNKILEKIGELGIVPVVKIEKAEDALPLGRALIDGDLPMAEITFRTSAAEESIKTLTGELPNLLVGAGTVYRCKIYSHRRG